MDQEYCSKCHVTLKGQNPPVDTLTSGYIIMIIIYFFILLVVGASIVNSSMDVTVSLQFSNYGYSVKPVIMVNYICLFRSSFPGGGPCGLVRILHGVSWRSQDSKWTPPWSLSECGSWNHYAQTWFPQTPTSLQIIQDSCAGCQTSCTGCMASSGKRT